MNTQESETSFVEDVFGGDATSDDHSQEQTANQDGKAENNETKPNAEEDFTIPDDETDSIDENDDGGDFSDDNGTDDKSGDGTKPPEDKTAPEKDSAELKQEVANLQKRLHDTQAAMHKATTERAALQKELDALKAKKENEDDWFSEDDTAREKELEANLKKADEDIAKQQAEQDDLKRQEAASVWDAAAAPVIKQHPDFEKVMYEQFAPLLDPKTGNQQVIKAWGELKDKSPASAYQFAKEQLDILEFQKDPKAYKAKLLKSNNNNRSEGIFEEAPSGKDGLDMLNSADVGTSPPEKIGSFVDAVFPD